MIPDTIQRMARHGRNRGREIRTAESAEAVLFGRMEVGIAEVHWRADEPEHEVRSEECLKKHVDVCVRTKPAGIMKVAKLRIILQHHSAADAILDLLKSRRVGHEIDLRHERDELLA